MLPARQRALSSGLAAIQTQQARGTEVRLRIRGVNGAMVEGPLVSAEQGHVAIRARHGGVIDFAPEQIGALAIARPRRGREWVLAGVGIVAGTAAIGGLVSLPVVGEYLRSNVQVAFQVVFFAGVAVLIVLRAGTQLRDWLTRWETLFDTHDP